MGREGSRPYSLHLKLNEYIIATNKETTTNCPFNITMKEYPKKHKKRLTIHSSVGWHPYIYRLMLYCEQGSVVGDRCTGYVCVSKTATQQVFHAQQFQWFLCIKNHPPLKKHPASGRKQSSGRKQVMGMKEDKVLFHQLRCSTFNHTSAFFNL